MLKNLIRSKKGAALLEYSLLAAGVSLIASAGISVFGHKTNDLISSVAAVLPGIHDDDNGPIASGKIIETTGPGGGQIGLDVATIVTNSGTERLGNNIGVAGLPTLVLEQ
ncbi:MAG: hypothetical protein AAF368_10415 [Planctomycetota bacterium]